MTHIHDIRQEFVINEILHHIAYESNRSIEKIKRLLLIKKNTAVNNRFWEILDNSMPNHGFNYMGCCAQCGSLELL